MEDTEREAHGIFRDHLSQRTARTELGDEVDAMSVFEHVAQR